MPLVKSNIWKVFIKTNIEGKCELCHCKVKTTEGMTNLRKHFTRPHPKFNLNVQLKK